MGTTETAKSTCCYCGVGCGVEVERSGNGDISVSGDEEHPANRGMLCSKGRNLHQTVMDRDHRLRHPMMTRGGDDLEQVSWDAAMGRVSNTFRRLIDTQGPDSVGFYVSGQFMTEEYYVANKLMKGFIGSNNIDTNSRLCMSSAVVGYQKAIGEDTPPIHYDDIENCECFLIAGANPAFCHPILFRRIERHKEQNPDTTVIVADPRETDTCSIADRHLQVKPGTDITLFNAIAAHLLEEGLIDYDFIQEHTDGFEALADHLHAVDIDEAAEACGVPARDIRETAEDIGRSETFMSMWAMGLNQSEEGTEKNLALLNLSFLTGQIGKPGSGPFSLTGQPNAMGGREVGGMAGKLAAHHDLSDPQHRQKVADFWGVDHIQAEPGYSATEMIDALEAGDLKAVWIMCTNPLVSLPDAERAERALAEADLVVAQDISAEADTVHHADVVLPAAGWLEKEGTMTNSDRRVSHLPKMVDPPGEARPDVRILCDFAKRMGWGESFDYDHESEIYAEHAALTEGTNIDVSGLSYERLKEEGTVKWPCPSEDHPGTDRLFEDKEFFTENGRANLYPVLSETASQEVDDDYPLVLTTGRIRDQWHTMTKTGTVNRLNQHVDKPKLQIHPSDAERMELEDGETVEVESQQGSVTVNVDINSRLRSGVVFLPMHWGKQLNGTDGRANAVTRSDIDPMSKQPAYKYTPVRVKKVKKEKERVIVVGAGASARQFVESYRKQNEDDRLLIFGREPHGFYNRVLLPEYISEHRDWENLRTAEDDIEDRLDINVQWGTEIIELSPETKEVRDDSGAIYGYDRLVLCTGSRAFVPPGVPMKADGIYTLRTRDNADKIKEAVDSGDPAVVMGGGLLGLELASELNRMDVDVTIVELSDHLMHRQLDQTASELLRDELEERGIEVVTGDLIDSYLGDDGRIEAVRTREGRKFRCEALFVAVGTRCNKGLAEQADLDTDRGVIVDDYLRTSDENIFALGEIAEHDGQLYGITPVAQEQAEIAAKYITGDPWSQYDGSVLFNILKIHGLDVRSAGTVKIPTDEDGTEKEGYEEVKFLDRTQRVYRKCVVRNNRLVGVALIGDATGFNEYKRLIEEGIELNEKRSELLRPDGGGNSEPIKGELVCSCNQVGTGNIEEKIEDGCTDVDALKAETKAGTGCGSCIPELKMMLADAEAEACGAPA
jgi:ferredoxin-nitrate reductase